MVVVQEREPVGQEARVSRVSHQAWHSLHCQRGFLWDVNP